MVVIATSGATMALNEVMEKNPSLHDVQAQVNRDTLQVRVAEDAEFLGTESYLSEASGKLPRKYMPNSLQRPLTFGPESRAS